MVLIFTYLVNIKTVRGRSQTMLTRFWLFLTTYLPHLVNVVCERPLRRMAPIFVAFSEELNFISKNSNKANFFQVRAHAKKDGKKKKNYILEKKIFMYLVNMVMLIFHR